MVDQFLIGEVLTLFRILRLLLLLYKRSMLNSSCYRIGQVIKIDNLRFTLLLLCHWLNNLRLLNLHSLCNSIINHFSIAYILDVWYLSDGLQIRNFASLYQSLKVISQLFRAQFLNNGSNNVLKRTCCPRVHCRTSCLLLLNNLRS